MDRRLEAPAGLPLLRAIPMFGPLNPVTLDALARALVRVEVAAGDVVVREGDESDRFYVIESGTVQVTAADGHVLREEGPGDYFGEIGLLRDVPRTATITAARGHRPAGPRARGVPRRRDRSGRGPPPGRGRRRTPAPGLSRRVPTESRAGARRTS